MITSIQTWFRCKMLGHVIFVKGNTKVCVECGTRWPNESKEETIRKIKELNRDNS